MPPPVNSLLPQQFWFDRPGNGAIYVGVDTAVNPTGQLLALDIGNVNNKLPLAGGNLTGPLTLAGDPTVGLGACTKQYADKFLPLAGGGLTGGLGVFNKPAPGTAPVVTGSRAGNAALASLLTELADCGFIIDSTTA